MRSSLADRAMEGAALPGAANPDRTATANTRLPTTPVNTEALLEVTTRSVAIDVITQCRATLGDGALQHLANSLRKGIVTCSSDATRLPPGIDSGKKQGFAGVDIPHAHHNVSIHQELLHAGATSARTPIQVRAIEFPFLQGLWSQFTQQRVP